MFAFIHLYLFLFFFFQAEDGIRDPLVTGVQTCALPIYPSSRSRRQYSVRLSSEAKLPVFFHARRPCAAKRKRRLETDRRKNPDCVEDRARSEERRVGKESRCERVRDE